MLLDTFMYRLNVNLKILLCSSLIITLITRNNKSDSYYRHYCYLSGAMTRLTLIGTILYFISSPLHCCHKPRTSDPIRTGPQDYIWWHVAHPCVNGDYKDSELSLLLLIWPPGSVSCETIEDWDNCLIAGVMCIDQQGMREWKVFWVQSFHQKTDTASVKIFPFLDRLWREDVLYRKKIE